MRAGETNSLLYEVACIGVAAVVLLTGLLQLPGIRFARPPGGKPAESSTQDG